MNEKYIPLYRKYRPQTLGEMVGQEHIKKALANAISLNKISHAYLFTGPRGTGKTSSARILAKSLNCKNGPTIEPCGVCESCKDITNSIPIDVIEIDAASNRKVEDAQNILEKIQYVPVKGKYKIYIIDEVHMLTNHAFNALLKTLEEPPQNVVFILATTEVHKVLDTIKSRCQRFDFKRITTTDIIKHLKHLAELEKINIEDDALFTIAKNSAGGMRDSIALLDQLSVLDNSRAITTDDINNLLGRLSFDTLNVLSEKILNSSAQDAIEDLELIYNAGNEPSQILVNMLDYFKNLLITKNCKKDIIFELTQLNDEQIKILQEQAARVDTHQIVFLIERISYYIREVKASSNQHLWLEVAMIDLANLANNTSLLELQNRLAKLEGNPQAVVPVQKTPAAPVSKPIMKPSAPKISVPIVEEKKPEPIKEEAKVETPKEVEEEFSPMPKSQPKPLNTDNLRSAWAELLSNIQSPSTQALLKLANPIIISPESVIITFKQDIFVKQGNDPVKKQPIIDAADKLFNQKGTNVIIRLPMTDDKVLAKTAPTPTPAPKVIPEVSKPEIKDETEDFKEEIEQIDEEKKSPEEIVPSDQVKMVMDLFDGKYID